MAKLLRLDAAHAAKTPYPLVFEPAPATTSELFEVVLPPGGAAGGKKSVDLDLPDGTLIVLVSRGGDFLVAPGSLSLEPDDKAPCSPMRRESLMSVHCSKRLSRPKPRDSDGYGRIPARLHSLAAT